MLATIVAAAPAARAAPAVAYRANTARGERGSWVWADRLGMGYGYLASLTNSECPGSTRATVVVLVNVEATIVRGGRRYDVGYLAVARGPQDWSGLATQAARTRGPRACRVSFTQRCSPSGSHGSTWAGASLLAACAQPARARYV